MKEAEKLMEIAEKSKYDPNAYAFVSLGISGIQRKIEREEGELRHVTGQELYEYLLDGAQDIFGFLAKTVLNEWGVHRTEDIGEIVFDMVENKLMGKCKDDSQDDFSNGPEFSTLETEYKITIPEDE